MTIENETYEKCMAEARRLGVEHNAHEGPTLLDLSGQWADTPAGPHVFRTIVSHFIDPDSDDASDIFTEVLDAYEEAYTSGVDNTVGPDVYAKVAVLKQTRHYGGPEEGGWWYNRQECVAVVVVTEGWDAEDTGKLGSYFQETYGYGDIYSVRGGASYAAYHYSTGQVCPWTAGDIEPKERPRYE